MPKERKNCLKYRDLNYWITYEILLSNFQGAEEIVLIKEILESWKVEL